MLRSNIGTSFYGVNIFIDNVFMTAGHSITPTVSISYVAYKYIVLSVGEPCIGTNGPARPE